jgi:hypothetical protein
MAACRFREIKEHYIMKATDDGYILSTGREFYANNSIIGMAVFDKTK